MNETLSKPNQDAPLNVYLSALQCLALYRDICRHELLAEAVVTSPKQLTEIRQTRKNTEHQIVSLFVAAQSPPKIRIQRYDDIPWPAPWEPYFNGSIPCDRLIGNCACGEWHTENSPRVQRLLESHHAIIVDDTDGE